MINLIIFFSEVRLWNAATHLRKNVELNSVQNISKMPVHF